MDEKELTRKIKNSLKSGKSKAEITKNLQNRGYKLEYIDALISKAGGKKLLFSFILVFLLLIVSLLALGSVVSYNLFFKSPGIENKANLTNPLAGLKINFDKKSSSQELMNQTGYANNIESEEEVYLEDIEITSDFISYLLNELGAWQLKKNPITSEKPIINFEIDGKEFNSIIEQGTISTTEGLDTDPDLTFHSNKEDIVLAMLSDAPDAVFKESYSNEKSSFELQKSEPELMVKGYYLLYKSLNE